MKSPNRKKKYKRMKQLCHKTFAVDIMSSKRMGSSTSFLSYKIEPKPYSNKNKNVSIPFHLFSFQHSVLHSSSEVKLIPVVPIYQPIPFPSITLVTSNTIVFQRGTGEASKFRSHIERRLTVPRERELRCVLSTGVKFCCNKSLFSTLYSLLVLLLSQPNKTNLDRRRCVDIRMSSCMSSKARAR